MPNYKYTALNNNGSKKIGILSASSEREARKLNPDYFLVLPVAFINEFIKRESKWLKKGGKFIVPFPNFRVISKS